MQTLCSAELSSADTVSFAGELRALCCADSQQCFGTSNAHYILPGNTLLYSFAAHMIARSSTLSRLVASAAA